MKRVTGIGGIFFKAKDPKALQDWYERHLGIDVHPWGGAAFDWTDEAGKPIGGTTAWNIVSDDGESFAPGTAPFMVNYGSPISAGSSRHSRMRGATSWVKPKSPTTARSAGCSTPKATRWSCGSRLPAASSRSGARVELTYRRVTPAYRF